MTMYVEPELRAAFLTRKLPTSINRTTTTTAYVWGVFSDAERALLAAELEEGRHANGSLVAYRPAVDGGWWLSVTVQKS